MYKKTEHQLTFVDDFFLPFGGKLNKENRWELAPGKSRKLSASSLGM
ncbi:hypothetical protein [Heyndrickxia coagulans]|nr:hypothetical protein [Heyndrickxia coagulans]QJE32391.1 hypothetical protein HHU11_07005 [Heyndrickxia coagulans]